jgi:ribosome maturation factor RimP
VDDDNNIEVTIDKQGGADLSDCEYVHRAVLAAFDRDIEDYALTVGSVGISAEEADSLLSKDE